MGKPTLVELFDFNTHSQNRPKIPASAESIDLSELLSPNIKPSKLIPGLKVKGPSTFTCPQCLSQHKEPKHGSRFFCSNCKLHMEVYGNLLVFWIIDKKE